MENKLEFNAEEHIYRLNGAIIPGFSEIAKAEGMVNFDSVPDHRLEAARNFGSCFHFTTKLSDEHNLDLSTVAPSLLVCLEGYNKALVGYKIEILQEYIEKPICSYIYRYGVTPDRICLFQGNLAVLEIKTNTVMTNATALQTAAQQIAAEEYYKIKIKHRIAFQVTVGGDFKFHSYTNKQDKYNWLAFVSTYNWKKLNLKGA